MPPAEYEELYNAPLYFELAIRLGDWASIKNNLLNTRRCCSMLQIRHLIMTCLHISKNIFISITLMMCIDLYPHTFSGFSFLRMLEVPFQITIIKKIPSLTWSLRCNFLLIPQTEKTTTSSEHSICMVSLAITATCKEQKHFLITVWNQRVSQSKNYQNVLNVGPVEIIRPLILGQLRRLCLHVTKYPPVRNIYFTRQ